MGKVSKPRWNLTSWLSKRYNMVSWVRFLREDRMSPYKLASPGSKAMSFVCLPSQDNVCALKLFMENSSWLSCVRLANEKGICPENLLNERDKTMRLVRLPRETRVWKSQYSIKDFRFPIELGSLHMCSSSSTLMPWAQPYKTWVGHFSCRCGTALKVFPCHLRTKLCGLVPK